MSNITLLLKYENPQHLTDIITHWLYGDTFLQDFLIPSFEECYPGMVHNNDLAILNAKPYRLFMLMIQTPTSNYENMTYTYVQNSQNNEKLSIVNYITHSRFLTIPLNVRLALTAQMIIDMHLCVTRFRLCVCDLYLSRPGGSTNIFHQDSGKTQDGSQLMGHENLKYISLLYLSRSPNKLLRGTGIMSSNLMTDTHHSMVSLRVKSGTKLMIHDGAFFHCTPSTTLTETPIIHNVFPEHGITAMELSVRENFTPRDIAEIENAGPREFIRGHYIDLPRYFYTDIESVDIAAFVIDQLAIVKAQREATPKIILEVDPNNVGLDAAIERLASTDHAIGGGKSKKNSRKQRGGVKKNSRKQRGGVKNEMLIISCEPASFYALSKFNTNFSFIF
jgi:hypothetical protein